MSSSFHVDSVNTHEPAPIHNVVRGECWRNVKPSAELPFTPFWNWEENAQTSARKRVIFAFTSNFHYRRVLSFLYLLTRRAGFVVPPRWFFFLFQTGDWHAPLWREHSRSLANKNETKGSFCYWLAGLYRYHVFDRQKLKNFILIIMRNCYGLSATLYYEGNYLLHFKPFSRSVYKLDRIQNTAKQVSHLLYLLRCYVSEMQRIFVYYPVSSSFKPFRYPTA